MVEAALPDLLRGYLREPDSSWTCGGFGALAEFNFDIDEPVEFTDGPEIGAATARGAFRLGMLPALRPVAYETVSKTGKGWGQGLVLCLPQDLARMGERTVVTELGPDVDAIRSQDRGAILFDLGIGKPQSDICVRSGDPHTVELLRAACGQPLFAQTGALLQHMPALSPHRVFRSRAARVEVYQRIPPPDGRTPDGPHTHVRPNLVRHRRSHAATVPVPPGFLPALWLFPPHPLRHASGVATRFDVARHESFQALLRRFGDPEALRGKAAASDAELSTRIARLAFRVAERQRTARQSVGA